MQNCINCSKENKILRSSFDVIGKTYYKINKDTVMCYRHWYQSGRPKYQLSGDYYSIIRELNKAEYLQENYLK